MKYGFTKWVYIEFILGLDGASKVVCGSSTGYHDMYDSRGIRVKFGVSADVITGVK